MFVVFENDKSDPANLVVACYSLDRASAVAKERGLTVVEASPEQVAKFHAARKGAAAKTKAK